MTGGITVKKRLLVFIFSTLIPAARWIEFFENAKSASQLLRENEVTEMIRISEFVVLYYK